MQVDTTGNGETVNLNVLVFDNGAVNHCQAPDGEAKSHMPGSA